jgi:hypothetical protein
MNDNLKSRFCYSYKPSGIVNNCCDTVKCHDISALSSISSITFKTTQTSERSLLLQSQQQYLDATYTATNNALIQSTINNSASITSTMYGQLLQVRRDRYEPYQPYMPPIIPSSVVQLQMNTVNVGVPHSFFTCADSKGVQFVTT